MYLLTVSETLETSIYTKDKCKLRLLFLRVLVFYAMLFYFYHKDY